MDAKIATAQAHYEQTFYRTVHYRQQLYAQQHVFVDRQLSPMTESARMETAPPMEALPKTFDPYNEISVMQDTVKVDENVIDNTLSMDRVTLSLYSKQGNEGIQCTAIQERK